MANLAVANLAVAESAFVYRHSLYWHAGTPGAFANPIICVAAALCVFCFAEVLVFPAGIVCDVALKEGFARKCVRYCAANGTVGGPEFSFQPELLFAAHWVAVLPNHQREPTVELLIAWRTLLTFEGISDASIPSLEPIPKAAPIAAKRPQRNRKHTRRPQRR